MKPDQKTFRSPLNYMLAFGTECVRPLLKSAARVFCSSPPTSPPEWRRGILIGADHIGDLLWLTPSLPALQAGLPRCEWYVVASAPGREVLEGNPYVKRVISPRLPREKIYCDRALMVEIRALRPDVALCYDSGDYWRGLLMALRCGIPNRVAYTHKGFSGLITLPVRIEFPQPYPAYFRGLVAQLTGVSNIGQLRPVIYPTTEDCAAAEKVWEEIRPPTGKPVVAVFPMSRQQYGTWPPERFGAAVAHLKKICSVDILLCGAASDMRLLRALQSAFCPDAKVLEGRLNLRALTVLLRNCKLALTTDSGPRHLANAAGIPVVFLRNLWARRIETDPYLPTETDLAPPLECLRLPPHKMESLPPSPGEIAECVARQVLDSRK